MVAEHLIITVQHVRISVRVGGRHGEAVDTFRNKLQVHEQLSDQVCLHKEEHIATALLNCHFAQLVTLFIDCLFEWRQGSAEVHAVNIVRVSNLHNL